MLSEIGSSFWINPNKQYLLKNDINPQTFGITFSDFAWLSTGRSAIALALEHAKKNNYNNLKLALLPAYTCESVIEPFYKKGYQVEFFSLDERLEIDLDKLKDRISLVKPSVFLFHRYFGFDTAKGIEKIVEFCHEKGITVIEDRTQCLYSDINLSGADYYVGSIRKWCEAPDGGFIACRDKKIDEKPIESDLKIRDIFLEASNEKYNFIFNGTDDKSKFLKLYAESEELLENQEKLYNINYYSLAVQSTLNIQELKKKRQENYKVLLKGIKSLNRIRVMFDKLPRGVTPLYMPIIVDDRQAIQLKLREEAIYAPVIWPKTEKISGDDKIEYLYKHMLCIPIDQRYGTDDMQRIVDCLSKEKK